MMWEKIGDEYRSSDEAFKLVPSIENQATLDLLIRVGEDWVREPQAISLYEFGKRMSERSLVATIQNCETIFHSYAKRHRKAALKKQAKSKVRG
jgi:hypothetical protein